MALLTFAMSMYIGADRPVIKGAEPFMAQPEEQGEIIR